ncbi:ABC transporter ATP-binding protein [Synechococcus sp. PCC 7336]|uniref:ABC transporter ATP-binding protein n=1 Tax=Synechococcus sp. PCC 7336 TaxID=195250 RepID=UPI00035F8C77|nr:ABC transporter ATP-binding protein [Synechococcus sp. PCC 7336]
MTAATPVASKRPKTRPEHSDWWLLRKLWPYARPHWRLLALSIALLPPLAISQAIQPAILQGAIDGPIASGQLGGLWKFIAALLAVGLLRPVFQGLEGFTSQKLGQLLTSDIRNDLFRHITNLSSSYFDRTPVGKLITRITSDVEALGDVFSTGAVGVVSDLVTLVAIAGIMLWQRWNLALFLIGLIIPIALLVVWLQQLYRNANFRVREELSALNSLLQENILGVSVVQMFRRETYNSEIYYDTNQRYVREVDKTILYDSTLSAILEWVSWLGLAGILWLGGQEILQTVAVEGETLVAQSLPFIPNSLQERAAEPLTFGTLYAFILFSSQFFNPLRQLAEKFTSLQAGFTAVERITGMLELPIAVSDPAHPIPLPSPMRGEVQFEAVSFGYKPDELVLKNLSFTIRPGEKVALVGPTGAGKSSIIRLLARLYDASSGSIAIDGVDIRDLAQADLHRHVGTILQDPFLFSGNIRDNITLGEDYPEAEIRRAAQLMNVEPFILDLPRGYETEVRERGNNLSSGQKQLLAFARVMVRNPQILVLDEATASLDVGTESLIQDALETLLRDRTAIIIAHRLATIRNVDRILVLQRGELKEQGTHEQLMALNGIYASLYNLQSLQS